MFLDLKYFPPDIFQNPRPPPKEKKFLYSSRKKKYE